MLPPVSFTIIRKEAAPIASSHKAESISTGASHDNAVAEGREGATTITMRFPSPSYKPFVFTGQQRQLPILKKKNPPTNPLPSRHPEVISKLSFWIPSNFCMQRACNGS